MNYVNGQNSIIPKRKLHKLLTAKTQKYKEILDKRRYRIHFRLFKQRSRLFARIGASLSLPRKQVRGKQEIHK